MRFSVLAMPLEINAANLSLKIKNITPGIIAAAPKITPTPVSVIISARVISKYLFIKSIRKNTKPMPQAAPSGKDIILNSRLMAAFPFIFSALILFRNNSAIQSIASGLRVQIEQSIN